MDTITGITMDMGMGMDSVNNNQYTISNKQLKLKSY